MDENGADIIDLLDLAEDTDVSRYLKDSPWKDRRGLLCSAVLSVLLHLGAYAVLASVSMSYPIIAASSERDVLWFYPSLLLGATSPVAGHDSDADDKSYPPPPMEKAVPAPVTAPHAETPPVTRHEEKPAQVPMPGEMEVQAAVTLRSRPLIEELPKTIHGAVSPPPAPAMAKHQSEPKTEKMPAEEPKLPPPPERLSTPAPPDTPPAGTVQAIPPERQPVKRVQADVSPVEKAPRQAVAESEQGTLPPGSQETAVLPTVARQHETPPLGPPVKSEEKRVVHESASQVKAQSPAMMEKMALPAPVVLPKPETKPKPLVTAAGHAAPIPAPTGTRSATAGAVEAAPAVAHDNGKEKTSQPKDAASTVKGLLAAPLPGDLKIELLSGQVLGRGVKLAVLFREFPQTRRNRPLSKTESKRTTPVHPKVVAVAGRGNAIQAVVDKVGEGVYYVRLELEQEPYIDASVVVRMYESGPRAKTSSLPTRTLRHNETIVRILMPEGILWDDPAAFTGSLENSDSLTRFNTETGLVWKEYH